MDILKYQQEEPLIFDYFQNLLKLQIHMCVHRHPNFEDYINDPSAERHFKHLWNSIAQAFKVAQIPDLFYDNLSSIHDFSLFTPQYEKDYIDFIFNPERIEHICKACIGNSKFSQIFFHILIQIIVPQMPQKSLEMVLTVLKEYEKTTFDCTALRQLFNFYTNLLNIKNDAQARKLIYSIDYYLSFREESQNLSKLSSIQFSHILIKAFDKLTSFPSSLVRIIQYDPFIFLFLKCKEYSNINISQIPPFSSLLLSGEEVPKSFFNRYKEIFLSIINMLLIFTKQHFSSDERKALANFTSNVLSYVQAGPVGKDAFIFILIYFLRTDFLSKNAKIFFNYVSEGETKIENGEKEDSFISMCRFNSIAILVFCFDNEIFPSTITFISNSYLYSFILNTLKKLKDQFSDSPFKEKVESVFMKISGQPLQKKSIFERATQTTYQVWKNGFFGFNKSNAINLLIDLSQNRPCFLKNQGFFMNSNQECIKLFFQLALSFFSKNVFTLNQYPFYCYVGFVLFPIANTNTPKRNTSDSLLLDATKEADYYNLADDDSDFSKYPFHFYFNVNGRERNKNNVFFHLPRWHYLSISRELVINSMVQNIDFLSFLSRMEQGSPPSLFMGSILLFSRLIQNADQKAQDRFSEFLAHNPLFLPLFLQKATLFELPEVTRELMRAIEKCPVLSIDCIEALTNALLTTAKSHGYRAFIRFMAPLFRNEQYVSQIVIRDYYVKISEALLEFAQKEEIANSLSFVYFWRVIGTKFEYTLRAEQIKKLEEILHNMIKMSLADVSDSKNEDLILNALFEVTLNHGMEFFLFFLKCFDVEDQTSIEKNEAIVSKLKQLMMKIPRKLMLDLNADILSNLNSEVVGMIESLKGDDNKNDAQAKWVKWPIDEFVYDVTGLSYRCDK